MADFGLQDEDGAEISLQDESDWESAVDVAKDFSNGRGIGKVCLASCAYCRALIANGQLEVTVAL